MRRSRMGGTAVAALIMLAACRADPAGNEGPDEWRIAVAGGRGTVGAATSHRALDSAFAGELVDTMIHMGEGQFAPGTVVHAGDPLRRLEVVWHDADRERPWRVQVSGDSTRWLVGPGITLGTRLTELERLNGRPFSLTGFGWDYAGTVMGWGEGSLERALLGGNGRVILRLAPADTAPDAGDAAAVSGDAVFASEHPAMQRLDPAVYQIIVEFDAPPQAP